VACLLAGIWLACASVVGFVAAILDKAQARRQSGRVPEAAFHALALAGGWPGLLAGFVVARHKVRQARFLAVFLVAAALNVIGGFAVAGWLHC
jgi:uncharacterized membrane protein YsdA (DUF1294 family)